MSSQLYKVVDRRGRLHGANLDKRKAQSLADEIRRKGQSGSPLGDRSARAVPHAADEGELTVTANPLAELEQLATQIDTDTLRQLALDARTALGWAYEHLKVPPDLLNAWETEVLPVLVRLDVFFHNESTRTAGAATSPPANAYSDLRPLVPGKVVADTGRIAAYAGVDPGVVPTSAGASSAPDTDANDEEPSVEDLLDDD